MGKWWFPGEKWGTFVGIKTNAPLILRKQLLRIGKGRILIASVTDAYQPLEGRFGITRQCLAELVARNYGDEVSILTKSDLVLRDVDLFKKLPSVEVGLTITILDDEVASRFEPRAPRPSRRLKALKYLKERGIATYAFVGPIIPFFGDAPGDLRRLFLAVGRTGVGYILVDRMNYLAGKVGQRMEPIYHRYGKDATTALEYARTSEYEDELRGTIEDISGRMGVEVGILF